MQNTLLSLVLQIREQLRKTKQDYLKAVESGNALEARRVAEHITYLQAELEKLQPQKKGYQGL